MIKYIFVFSLFIAVCSSGFFERDITYDFCKLTYASYAEEVKKDNFVPDNVLPNLIARVKNNKNIPENRKILLQQSFNLEKEINVKELSSTKLGKNPTRIRQKEFYNNLVKCDGQIYSKEKEAVKKFRTQLKDKITKDEIKIFDKATGGKEVCSSDTSITWLFINNQHPKGCLFPIGPHPTVSVMQATKDGYLIEYGMYPLEMKLFFLYPSKETKHLADKSMLPMGFLESKGLFRYDSFLGERTVYSFKYSNIDFVETFTKNDLFFYFQ